MRQRGEVIGVSAAITFCENCGRKAFGSGRMIEMLRVFEQRGFRVVSACADHGGRYAVDLLGSDAELSGLARMIARINVLERTAGFEIYQIGGGRSVCRVLLSRAPDRVEAFAAAVRNDEHRQYGPRGSGNYDIKVGYSCNNACRHCVVRPNVWALEREGAELYHDPAFGLRCSRDLAFDEVVRQLMSAEVYSAGTVTITGGEPTIRGDFVDILMWLYYNRPDKVVVIQTNGRRLSDLNLVKSVRRFTRLVSFVVALHGPEEVHNYIANSRTGGNPFAETVAGIRNLQAVFGPELSLRTEIVLSNYNASCLLESVRFQHEILGVDNIGVSYPHLDGYPEEQIIALAPRMADLIEILQEVSRYSEEHPDLNILVEEIPVCVLRQVHGRGKFGLMRASPENTTVAFLNSVDRSFGQHWMECHAKAEGCSGCVLESQCPGVWRESLALNENALVPLKDCDEAGYASARSLPEERCGC